MTEQQLRFLAVTSDGLYWQDLRGTWWTKLDSGDWFPLMDQDVEDWLCANPTVHVEVLS